MDIRELLKYTVSHQASDLHLSSGMAPLVRIDDELQPVSGAAVLSSETITEMLYDIVTPETVEDLNAKLDVDFAIGLAGINSRFRVNVFHQFRGISVAFRTIPIRVPTIFELGLPDIFYRLCNSQNGLILVTGPTGCGKSTTLAAMIDHVNGTQQSHILTIEDPIEYLHQSRQCLVQQREIGMHTKSFDSALRAALREDPDYILVGEMRDLETIRLALTAAETGHLVFASLHTKSAAESIDRIVDVFPTYEKAMIRSMVANSLQAIVSQMLLKKIGGGRVAIHEIMLCTPAIRNMIRENKIPQMYSTIQTSQDKGMQTFEQNIQTLIEKNMVDADNYRDLVYNVF